MTSSKRAFFSTLLFALAVPMTASAQRTAQDIESARQLYNQGMDLKEKGDLKGALEKLRAAHALGNTPITGIELCRTHAALKQPVEAREVCLGVARIPPLAQETQRSHDARAEAGRIAESEKPKMSALRLKVTGVPAGWEPTVVVDGATVPLAALGEPRSVNPGTHTVSARVGTGVETKTSLETKEGETRDIELIVQAPPQGEKPVPVVGTQRQETEPPTPHQEKKSNPVATAGFVIGGVGALVGTVAGLVAMSDESDLSKKCAQKACGRDLHDDLDAAKTWGNVSTAFFIIAGIGIGTGLIATIVASSTKSASSTPPSRTAMKPHITPVLGLGGGGVYGSF
jgi:hypothetical protein